MATPQSPPVALVTGASSGIGAAACRWLAARGYDVVGVARRGDRLARLADELRAAHGATVLPLVHDLGHEGAPQRIFAEVRARGLVVDTLVNNAGYGVPGRFLSSPWPVHAAFGQVMVTAVAELTYLFLPAMIERRRGSVINIASVAGLLPGTSGHTLYAAAKSWMINFSESLALEYGQDGIRVCAVCPGFTYSEFHDVTGTRGRVAKLPRWMWMTADAVVASGFAAAARGEIVHVPGRVYRLLVAVSRLLPQRVGRALTRREAHRFRDAD